MEQYYTDFINNLKLLITEIDSYYSTPGTHKFLLAFDKLNMVKLITRYHKIASKYETQIHAKDNGLFLLNDFNLFPSVHLQAIWPNLNNTLQDRVWVYLQLLLMSSTFIFNSVKTEDTKNQLSFNPYEGIKSNSTDPNSGDISLEDLVKETQQATDNTTSANPLGAIGSMLGLGSNMFDMDGIANEFKNINVDEIETATNNIRDLLADNLDKSTCDMLSDLLNDIGSELKNSTTDTSNPIDKMTKIAEKVAQKRGPQIQNQNIDPKKLWKSTKDIYNKCAQGENKMFGGANPMDMLNSFMEKQFNNPNPNSQTEEQYMNTCQDMLNSMGMNGVDLANVMPHMSNVMNNMKNNNPTKSRLQQKLAQKKKNEK